MAVSHAELMERHRSKSRGRNIVTLEDLCDKEGDSLARRFKGVESDVRIEYGEDVQEHIAKVRGVEHACR